MRTAFAAAIGFVAILGTPTAPAQAAARGYADLVELSNQWRQFARPEIVNCLPDYGVAAMAKKAENLEGYRSRLDAIKTDGWAESEQIDYQLFRAELNGMDFDLRVLR